MRYRWWLTSLAAVFAGGACGQTSDVIVQPEEPPAPVVVDTGWETDFEACASERVEAAVVGTSLFLAVDTSCSMADPADGSTTGTTPATITKWDAATSAFTAFFTDPASATVDVALRLWPTTSDACNGDDCDADACSVPQVPLDSVGNPDHQQALIDAFLGTSPSGGTPMHAALDGAVRWATAHHASAPEEQVAIVFVTDGEPNGCDEDIANIASLAASASSAGVPVYAVGIEGSNVAQMDQIAQAGATGSGYFVGSTNAEADLIAALKDIQAKVVSCEFAFPAESTGDPLSPDLVRVEYTIDGELVLVQRIAEAAMCEPDGGWYLDESGDPTTITLCPSTCAELQGIATVAIEIEVGCECVTDEDCPGDAVCSSEGCVPPCLGPDCLDTAGGPAPIFGGQAVQGGAMNCATAPAPAGFLVLLAGLAAARSRRRSH